MRNHVIGNHVSQGIAVVVCKFWVLLVNQIDVNGGYFPNDQKSKLLRKGGRKNVPYIFVNNFFCRRSEAGTDISALTVSVKSLQFYCYVECMYTY